MTDIVQLLPYGGAGVALFAAGGYYGLKIVQAVKNGKNGNGQEKAPQCPAKEVLDRHSEVLVRYTEAATGLIEAVDRNTKQSELATSTMVKLLLEGRQ